MSSLRRNWITDEQLADIFCMPLGDILDWCCEGRFEGAVYHRLNRRWYIPLPLRYRHGS